MPYNLRPRLPSSKIFIYCELCRSVSHGRVSISAPDPIILLRDHARDHKRQVDMVSPGTSLNLLFSMCFLEPNGNGNQKTGRSTVSKKRTNGRKGKKAQKGKGRRRCQNGMQPLSDRCHRLIPKDPRRKLVRCKECRKSKQFYDRQGYINVHLVFDHLRMHVDNSLVRCRFCDFKCNQVANVRNHLKKKHGKLGTAENYIDLAAESMGRMMGMANRCFGK